MSDHSGARKKSTARVVAVLRSVHHLSYFQSTLEALIAQGASVQMVFDPQWSAGRSTEFVKEWERKHGLTPFLWAARRNDRWRRPLFLLRELRTYGSYLRRQDQSSYYLRRWRGYLGNRTRAQLQRRTVGKILNFLLGSTAFEWAARAFEWLAPADPGIVRFLKELNPTVVLVTPANMRFSEEVEYLKAARRLRVPTVLPVYSWDNLTTKGLIHCKPSLLLAWNATHAKEAQGIHGIALPRIAITGSPFFDKWFFAPPVGEADKKEYLERVGLDPNRAFVTYLGSSSNIASDETWLVEKLALALEASADPRLNQLQILVRPHPAHYKVFTKAFPRNVGVWPRPPFEFENGVPETQAALRDFQLALRFASATIGINTSAMVEAVIEDKPCLTYLSDLYRSTQEEANHFRTLAGCLYPVRTVEESLGRLTALLEGRDELGPARRKFVLDFVRPHGLGSPAAGFQSLAILQLSLGTPARQLSRLLANPNKAMVPFGNIAPA